VGWHALAIPLGCTVAALTVLGVEWGDGVLGVGEVCALGCVVASLARTALTFTELRSLHEARRQADTDHLTGLPNRRALAAQMHGLTRDRRRAALILLDLDGFKAVNDGLGHDAGDELLRRLGDRLRPALRPEDVLYRLGGDEFAVLLPDAPAGAADDCARRIHDLVCRPVELGGVPVQVGASLGIAATPDQAATIEELLRCADRAMYEAKAARGGVRWFAAGESAPERARGAVEPRDAAAPLLFRPLVADDGVAAVDVLHRQESPGRPPAADLTALDGALTAVARWWATSPVPVQLTLTPTDLRSPRLPDRVAAALLRAGLPAGALLLRLDRPALSAVPEEVPTVLAALRSRGIHTVVELHGSSALALARLRDLPADRIALDPEVVAEVVTDSRTSLVVGHTVALSRALGSRVYAASTDARTDASLTRLGCTVLRTPTGPVAADAVASWLSERVADAPGLSVG
jgi:diguanylate cyclase (GGDEF)-like protein